MTRTEAREILGLGETYTAEDLRKAYRVKVSASHPDKPTGGAWWFRRVRAAHDLLTGPDDVSDTTPHGQPSTSQDGPQTPTRDLSPMVKDILETIADDQSTKGLESLIGERAGPAQTAVRAFLSVFGSSSSKRKRKGKAK